MKRWICVAMFASGLWHAHAAEEGFSRVVGRDDFAAAGLTKLSPEELARLDTLVRDYQTGALVSARRELEAAQKKAAKAEADAREADAKAAAATNRLGGEPSKPSPSLLDRARVLLTPGTKVEYSTLESRLAHDFVGWQRNTIFRLENGQRWRVVGDREYVTPPMPAPKVKIVPGALGSFWIEIEGVRQRAKVEAIGN